MNSWADRLPYPHEDNRTQRRPARLAQMLHDQAAIDQLLAAKDAGQLRDMLLELEEHALEKK